VGCGDIGTRLVRQQRHLRILALTSQSEKIPGLRKLGLTPLKGNLDDALTLRRLAGLATRVVHLAPTSSNGERDLRTTALWRALSLRAKPVQLVYASTSGVYGNCQGAYVNETRVVKPQTSRAKRRDDAENQWRWWGRATGASTSILRIPGIYALDRPGGSPLERLARATPVLVAEDDVFTNHIHADDLARAIQLALWRGKSQRIYNVSDDSELLMGDYFDLAAEIWGMEKPARMSLEQAQHSLPSLLLSFMSESRRMINTRLKHELRLQLRYPTVKEGLKKTN
jgi:nucleoside-diphosphate-sugar epimerase